MARKQLFEFEDQKWLPSPVRDGQTDYFSFGAQLSSRPYEAFANKLRDAMKRSGSDTIVELGAGGGGHSLAIARHLSKTGFTLRKVVLTDLFPNIPRLQLAAKKQSKITVEVVKMPVNAASVLAGFRLICNAFHHLQPQDAVECLADAVRQKQGVAVMEFVGPSLSGFFQVILGVLLMFLAMPFIRPFRFSRILFTYLVPLIPLTTLWDGIVSCLRVYSPNELRALVSSVHENNLYAWDIGVIRVPFMPIVVTYLIGTP